MNQQQPDKFFREKLQHYQKPAPQGAWNRIESALEKKTAPKFEWWKIAAVFFLVAGAAYLLWFNDTSSTPPPLARAEDQATEIPEKQEEEKPKALVGDQMSGAAENKNHETSPPPSVSRVPQATNLEVKSPTAMKSEPIAAEEPDPGSQLPPQETVSPTVIHSETQVTKSTITLTFSSDETSQYLNKNALAEATSNEKKPSSLKKFLKKANDLKSNQDPFGDLRERKNEILALNFKNDKRGQNK